MANHFLDLAAKDGLRLTHMKLQKLLYYAHGWHLAFFDGEPLVAEGFEAWKHGPVSHNVYDAFRQFGANPIDEPAMRVVSKADGYYRESVPPIPESDGQTLRHLEKVYKAYRKYTAGQLSAATHAEGTPWAQVKGKYPDNGIKVRIENSTIQDHFRNRMAAAEARQ